MLSSRQWRMLLRTGSLSFALNNRSGANLGRVDTFRWKGHPIDYRAGTADAALIYQVLVRPTVILRPDKRFFKERRLEYWVPPEVNPSVILDVGGNIGISAIYYSWLFPQAKIHTFEPVKSNFEMLRRNTASLSNVTTHNVGLGTRDCFAEISACEDSTNTGGFSLYGLEVDGTKTQEVSLKKTDDYLRAIGITKVDLIKIDTEGAEFDILTTMNQEMLSNARWIIGELHGHRDFELLEYLSKWFDIGVRKTIQSRLFNFSARNKRFAKEIPWKY